MLRERHEGRIVTFSFRDGDASQARVFLELARGGHRLRARLRRDQRHPGSRVRPPDPRADRRRRRDRRGPRRDRARHTDRDGGALTWTHSSICCPQLWRGGRGRPCTSSPSACSSAAIGGLVVGTGLYVTRAGGLILATGAVYGVLNVLVNIFRPIPFIIFMAAVQPLTRAVIGTGIGNERAHLRHLARRRRSRIGRIVEQNLLTVSPGVIEAARVDGRRADRGSCCTVAAARGARPADPRLHVRRSSPSSTCRRSAGYIGGGGLGDFAIRTATASSSRSSRGPRC